MLFIRVWVRFAASEAPIVTCVSASGLSTGCLPWCNGNVGGLCLQYLLHWQSGRSLSSLLARPLYDQVQLVLWRLVTRSMLGRRAHCGLDPGSHSSVY